MRKEERKSMYRKDSVRWIKHVDFIILDLICLQVAFVLAYAFSGYGANPYQLILYRNMAVFIEVADLVVLFVMGTLKNVLKRGHYKDFVVTVQHGVILGAIIILILVYASGRAAIFQTGIGAEYCDLYPTYLSGKRAVETFA